MIKRALAYAWAAPCTALGLVAGLAMLATGGRVRILRRTFEFSGGLLPLGLARLPQGLTWLPQGCRFSAITLGHVILGVNSPLLDTLRDHEQVHVAQYERWGPLFIPTYVLSSAWQMCRGRCAYRDNYFERQAYASAAAQATPQGGSARAISASKLATASAVSTPNTTA